MRTYLPIACLKENSWAEDFTASQYTKEHFMYVQCMGHFIATSRYILSPRQNLHSFLLLYTVDGKGIVQYQDNTVELSAGYAVLINCTEQHSYRCAPGHTWNVRWVHFSGHSITGYINYITKNWKPVRFEHGEQKMMDLYTCVKNPDPVNEIQLSTMLIQLCSDIAVELKAKQTRASETLSPTIKLALAYYEEHFQEKLSLDTLSRELNVSKYHLAHQFKEQIGHSPHEYLTIIRLNYAKSLLRSTSQTINSISEKCGFDTSSYFIQAFKKHEGTTPLKYRTYYRNLENT